ncbi:hypothetical protein BDV27DRAFT_160710 [Aspergillus caelatus]|uniref:Uncharacterized protein n=1 Tax=Aspergillus caelatus TaxID=61420 RepID=A0A5N6ZV77_9EURO|nr:uncharacterized protein BDV27DRAFT_160710 [Aspergillus caelatus]KAE8361467.1 hypothetical protein BDV27DRAFT_160710 [Aspergillus caelatus]
MFDRQQFATGKAEHKVFTWWTKHIADQDALDATKIDIQEMANIVAQSGTITELCQAFWGRGEPHEQTILNIGVLRFPDPSHAYFKLYRIKLSAWVDGSRTTFEMCDMNATKGEFYSRIFKARKAAIDQLKPEARANVVQEGEDLFA